MTITKFSYATDYDPLLPDDYGPLEDPESAGTVAVDLPAKRPSFHASIRGKLEELWRTSGRIRRIDVAGSTLLQYRCGACSQWGDGAFMHLGHQRNWKEFVSSRQPLTKAAAIAAYNDLNNLRFEHIVCNVNHVFENFSRLSDDEKTDRLQSHVLFHGYSKEKIRELNLAEVFSRLSTRYEESETAFGTTQSVPGKELLLAVPVTAHRDTGPVDPDKLRRPKWDRSTRAGLYAIWEGNGWVRQAVADGETVGRYYRCGSCGNWGEGHSMHLGHIVDWRTYLRECGVETVADARWAYNDLNNLRFEHPTCNMGHEWEGLDGVLTNLSAITMLRENHPDHAFFESFGARPPSEHILASQFRSMCFVVLSTLSQSEDSISDEGISIPTAFGEYLLTKEEWRTLKETCEHQDDAEAAGDRSVRVCGLPVPVGEFLRLREHVAGYEDDGFVVADGELDPLPAVESKESAIELPSRVTGRKRRAEEAFSVMPDSLTGASKDGFDLPQKQLCNVAPDEMLAYLSQFPVDTGEPKSPSSGAMEEGE